MIVGRPIQSGNLNELYIGDEAIDLKEMLKLKYPINHGIVDSYDDMEKIWRHCY